MDRFTLIACGIILIGFLSAWIFVIRVPTDQFKRKKRWLDQLPSIISTLGVLGTFLGITKGLLQFDTFDLDHSIPQLLDGLKTAFFTSLTGMSCSLILTRVVALKFQRDTSESDVERASREIVEAIHGLKEELPTLLENQNRHAINLWNERLKEFDQKWKDIVQLKDDVEETKGILQEVQEDYKAHGEASGKQVAVMIDIVEQTKALLSSQAANILSIELAVQGIAKEQGKKEYQEKLNNLDSIREINSDIQDRLKSLIELILHMQETYKFHCDTKGDFYAHLIKLFELINKRFVKFEQLWDDVVQIKDDVEEIKGIGQEHRDDISADRSYNKELFKEMRQIIEQTHALASTSAANMASMDLVLQRIDGEKNKAISAYSKLQRP